MRAVGRTIGSADRLLASSSILTHPSNTKRKSSRASVASAQPTAGASWEPPYAPENRAPPITHFLPEQPRTPQSHDSDTLLEQETNRHPLSPASVAQLTRRLG